MTIAELKQAIENESVIVHKDEPSIIVWPTKFDGTGYLVHVKQLTFNLSKISESYYWIDTDKVLSNFWTSKPVESKKSKVSEEISNLVDKFFKEFNDKKYDTNYMYYGVSSLSLHRTDKGVEYYLVVNPRDLGKYTLITNEEEAKAQIKRELESRYL